MTEEWKGEKDGNRKSVSKRVGKLEEEKEEKKEDGGGGGEEKEERGG